MFPPAAQRPDPARRPGGWLARAPGSLAVLTLVIFVALLPVAGIAGETRHTGHKPERMQAATDRAAPTMTIPPGRALMIGAATSPNHPLQPDADGLIDACCAIGRHIPLQSLRST